MSHLADLAHGWAHRVNVWSHRFGTLIVLVVFGAALVLAGVRIEQLQSKLDGTCQQRQAGRTAVRGLFIDGYDQMRTIQQLLDLTPSDRAALVAQVNEALPPIIC